MIDGLGEKKKKSVGGWGGFAPTSISPRSGNPVNEVS